MALFFHENEFSNGKKKIGFPRYREILERDFIHFFTINLITLIGFSPLCIGIIYALLKSNLLILIPSSLIGGSIFGLFFSGLLDLIFRSMRDSTSHYLKNYWKAIRQNALESIVTGIIVSAFIGIYAFFFLIWCPFDFVSIIFSILSIIIFISFFSIYWFQIILFRQTISQRIRNSILFIAKYIWKIVGISVLQIIYWVLGFLFLPYTLFLLPILGLWFISFLTVFKLYNLIDETFSYEKQLADTFPEQSPFYESDDEWLQKKQNTNIR